MDSILIGICIFSVVVFILAVLFFICLGIVKLPGYLKAIEAKKEKQRIEKEKERQEFLRKQYKKLQREEQKRLRRIRKAEKCNEIQGRINGARRDYELKFGVVSSSTLSTSTISTSTTLSTSTISTSTTSSSTTSSSTTSTSSTSSSSTLIDEDSWTTYMNCSKHGKMEVSFYKGKSYCPKCLSDLITEFRKEFSSVKDAKVHYINHPKKKKENKILKVIDKVSDTIGDIVDIIF